MTFFDKLFERDGGETYAELDALHEAALERDQQYNETEQD